MSENDMIKPNSYYVVQGFMVTKLGLKGNELLVYSIIYGFSQDGLNVFNGSVRYLEQFTGSTRKTVFNSLKTLTDRGLLLKEEYFVNGIKCCKYWADLDKVADYTPSVKITPTMEKITQTGVKITPPSVKITPYIIDNNIDNNYIKEKYKKEKSIKNVIPPSVEMVNDYCAENNYEIDAQQFCDFYESKGWVVGKSKMKDWQATVRTWVRKREQYSAPQKAQVSVKSEKEEVLARLMGGDN